MASREGNIRKELWLNSWGKILDIEVCHSGMSSPGRQCRITVKDLVLVEDGFNCLIL